MSVYIFTSTQKMRFFELSTFFMFKIFEENINAT